MKLEALKENKNDIDSIKPDATGEYYISNMMSPPKNCDGVFNNKEELIAAINQCHPDYKWYLERGPYDDPDNFMRSYKVIAINPNIKEVLYSGDVTVDDFRHATSEYIARKVLTLAKKSTEEAAHLIKAVRRAGKMTPELERIEQALKKSLRSSAASESQP